MSKEQCDETIAAFFGGGSGRAVSHEELAKLSDQDRVDLAQGVAALTVAYAGPATGADGQESGA